jgi:hypothetical protein
MVPFLSEGLGVLQLSEKHNLPEMLVNLLTVTKSCQWSGKNVGWALPTILIIPAFHSIGVDQKFRRDCPEKFLRICRTAAPGCPGTGWKACATKTIFMVYG